MFEFRAFEFFVGRLGIHAGPCRVSQSRDGPDHCTDIMSSCQTIISQQLVLVKVGPLLSTPRYKVRVAEDPSLF